MPNPEKILLSLKEHNVSESLIRQIMDGNDAIPAKSNKKQKAEFLAAAMTRLDELLDSGARREVIDWCACCKGGVREKAVKQFIRENQGKNLKEKVENLKKVANMGNPILNGDDTISCGIFWGDETGYQCPCPNFNGLKLEKPVSITYCYCCAGHFRHHFQNALGVKMETKAVASSVLASMGKEPCRFVFGIVR